MTKESNSSDSIKSREIEASFTDVNPSMPTPSATDATAEASWPPRQPFLLQNSNYQYQLVSQDTTTINNIFRSDSKTWKDFLFNLATELLLSFIEPDRFLKNSKAILFLVATYTVIKLNQVEIKTLLDLYLSYKK